MKRIKLMFILGIIALFFSCKKEDEVETIKPSTIPVNVPKVNASFSYEIQFVKDSVNTYLFKNTSKEANNFTWIISTGDTATSVDLEYKFRKLGTYKVTLIAKNDSFTHSFTRNIEVKDIVGLDSNKNPIPGPKPLADFEIYYNIDSSNYLHFKNRSSNFNKVIWKFGDNSESNELNPTHFFATKQKQSIKLIVEGRYNIKDSIIVEVTNAGGNSSLSLNYYIKSANPIVYTFFIKERYLNYITHIGFNPIPLVDQIPFSRIANYTFQGFEAHEYITYYKYDRVTQYKRNFTSDFQNYNSILSNATGTYMFDSRKKEVTTTANLNNVETTYFNDTSLVISEQNGKLRLFDSKLNHLFEGYLSSFSNNTNYVFYYEYDNSPNLGFSDFAFFNYDKNTNSLIVTRTKNYGEKTLIEYRGSK